MAKQRAARPAEREQTKTTEKGGSDDRQLGSASRAERELWGPNDLPGACSNLSEFPHALPSPAISFTTERILYTDESLSLSGSRGWQAGISETWRPGDKLRLRGPMCASHPIPYPPQPPCGVLLYLYVLHSGASPTSVAFAQGQSNQCGASTGSGKEA
jgi:hypothetical protein